MGGLAVLVESAGAPRERRPIRTRGARGAGGRTRRSVAALFAARDVDRTRAVTDYNPSMHRRRFLAMALALMATVSAVPHAQPSDSSESKRLRDATSVLTEIMSADDKSIPE